MMEVTKLCVYISLTLCINIQDQIKLASETKDTCWLIGHNYREIKMSRSCFYSKDLIFLCYHILITLIVTFVGSLSNLI